MMTDRMQVFEDSKENEAFLSDWQELVNTYGFQAVELEIVPNQAYGHTMRITMEGKRHRISTSILMEPQTFTRKGLLQKANRHLERWDGNLDGEKNLSEVLAKVTGKKMDKSAVN